MDRHLADIIVKVRFYATLEGGRKHPTPPVYRCGFVYMERNYDVGLLVGKSDPIWPDEEVSVPIKFASPELIKKELKVGDRFLIREDRVIAEGIIEEVLE